MIIAFSEEKFLIAVKKWKTFQNWKWNYVDGKRKLKMVRELVMGETKK